MIVRKPEAPSIPTPGQAYGFEENEDGTLRRQEPPDRDKSIGPAFYNADKVLNWLVHISYFVINLINIYC